MSLYPELRFPHEQLFKIAQDHPDTSFLRQPREGQWQGYTFAEIAQQVRQVACFLVKQGITPGERVIIFAKNSMEWAVADWAISLAGGVSVPIFAAADRETVAYIAQHSEARAAFVGKLDKYTPYEGVFDTLAFTVGFPYPTMRTSVSWQSVLDAEITDTVFPKRTMQDMMTIVYTSGSTGKPKGVVHTYESYAQGGYACVKNINDDEKLGRERVLSYLPFAHITERVVGEAMWLYGYEVGALFEVYFNESLDTFARDMGETKPTVFISVPRLWQKFQSGVLAGFPQKKLDLLLRIPLVSAMVKKKIKAKLGFSDTRLFASGSAPIAPSLLDWFEKLDIQIGQGWGMTETSAIGTAHVAYRSDKRETIGKVSYGIDLRIDEDNEIQVKGGPLFKEYYLQPDVTAESFTDDGYFKTGDQGSIDADGYVRIIGRLKDIFKTDKGKYVAPAPIEGKLSKSPLIDQCCVIGNNLPQPLALVILDEPSKSLTKADIEAQLTQLLNDVNHEIEKHERMSALLILPEPWTIESGLITPTLKIRRQVIEKAYEALSQQTFSESIVWC